MNRTQISVTLVTILALAACKAAPTGEAAKEADGKAAEAAIETPAEKPKISATEALTKVTCADFLAEAEVASAQPADDAALAAQDEIANDLTWLHGYLYATKKGQIEPLSQSWMETTAKRVYEACSAAEKPAEASLFEVATA